MVFRWRRKAAATTTQTRRMVAAGLPCHHATDLGEGGDAKWRREDAVFPKQEPRTQYGAEWLLVHTVQQALKALVGAPGLLQLCVFRFGFLQDGDVGVSVFPQIEEILIGGAGLGKGIRLWHGLATPIHQGFALGAPVVYNGREGWATCAGLKGVGAGEAETRQCTGRAIQNNVGKVEDFLKFPSALSSGPPSRTVSAIFRTTRRAPFTAASVGKASASSGSSNMRLVPARYRLTYLPRTPPFIEAKSYSGRMSLADRRLFFFIEPSFVACGSPGADDPTRTRHLLLRREVLAAQQIQEARVGEYESWGLPIESVDFLGTRVASQKR